MNTIQKILANIVLKTIELNKVYLPDESVVINYSAIFCQDTAEYRQFNKEASQIGEIFEDTPTGTLFKCKKPLQTPAGPLQLIKVRKPDMARFQRGDADFILSDYYSFKDGHLKNEEHFKLIERENYEMIELSDKEFDVLCYFSNIPLIVQPGMQK